MNKKVLLLGLLALFFLFNKDRIIPPKFDQPMAEYVHENSHNIPTAEREIATQSFRKIAEDIKKLVDPLFTPSYQLAYPQDAVVAVQSEILQRSQNPKLWDDFFVKLSTYIDKHSGDDGKYRTIYAVGEQFSVIANGLDPSVYNESSSINYTDFEDYGDSTESEIYIASLYQNGQISGVFLNQEDQPLEVREIAKADEQYFEILTESIDFGRFNMASGIGKGKRAIYHNYAYRFYNHPLPYEMKQISGNCVFSSLGDGGMTHLQAVNIFLYGESLKYGGPGASAWYAFRGHGGQGSTIPRAASVYLRYGYPLRRDYGNGWDLRDSVAEQRIGINNWRNPEQSLAYLVEQVKEYPVGKIEKLPSNFTEEYVLDLLYYGCIIHFGGTLIGRTDGDPISSVGGVGPHAMIAFGMDDSDEFKRFYKEKTGKTLNESVILFDNTWGSGPQYIQKNFPTNLWGKQTGGMYVLKWSDAKRLIQNGYVYYPNGMKGKPSLYVDYKLKRI